MPIEHTEMELIHETAVKNSFDAPVYYTAVTDSTMNIARRYAEAGYPHGTFIHAGMQTQGRGRLSGRRWTAEPDKNILGTLILRQAFDPAVTLRIGLAVSRTFDAYLPAQVRTAIKWPNDVLICGKKAAGIICETAGDCILAGMGLNILQTVFPPEIAHKSVSLAGIIGNTHSIDRTACIETLLDTVRTVLSETDWLNEMRKRLWQQGEHIQFMYGRTDSETTAGILYGVGDDGALLLQTAGTVRPYYSGEIKPIRNIPV